MAIHRADAALFGKEVVSSDGRDLGDLKDLEIDTDGWRVIGLVVKLNRDVLEDIHLKKPLLGSQEIVVSTAHVGGVGDKVILNKSLPEFGKLTGGAEPPSD